jgi:hypothetical protein
LNRVFGDSRHEEFRVIEESLQFREDKFSINDPVDSRQVTQAGRRKSPYARIGMAQEVKAPSLNPSPIIIKVSDAQ